MKELDRIFFGQSMVWREGFFYSLKDPSKEAWLECISQLVGKEAREFESGWQYALRIRKMHNQELNES